MSQLYEFYQGDRVRDYCSSPALEDLRYSTTGYVAVEGKRWRWRWLLACSFSLAGLSCSRSFEAVTVSL